MTKRIYLLLCFTASFVYSFSQAGSSVYQFLDLPVSSRLAALGGTNISLRDNDINFAFQNPSLLTSETHNTLSLNMANYLSDISFGSVAYGRTFGKDNYMAVGIQYVDYGKFGEYTELNDSVGTFTAKDYALSIMYARPLTTNISVGATLKPIYSVFEHYTSFGVAMDAGINYTSNDKLFGAGLVLRNIGTQLKGYYSDYNGQHFEPLPFDIQLGLTKKLLHAPLRFSLTLNKLNQWDLSYQSTNQQTTSISGVIEPQKRISFVDMAFRHTIFAAEFVPSKNFYLTVGYNHRRHQEMKMDGFKTMSGFSFGGGLKLYKFHVGFGMTQFQKGNYSYQFSISTALNEFKM